MAQSKLTKVTLRSYQVGFGDCYLLIFGYANGSEKFMLIDFGTTGLPDEFPKNQMLRVAKNIAERCRGKLHAVVATHRHKDHISGFSTEGDTIEISLRKTNNEIISEDEAGKLNPSEVTVKKMSSGDIIAACKPDFIIQPWTENPDLEDEKVKKEAGLTDSAKLKNNKDNNLLQNKTFGLMLNNMHVVANSVMDEALRLAKKKQEGLGFVQPISGTKGVLLATMGDNNIKNLSAVLNLRKMSKNIYVNYGTKLTEIEKIFGIKIHVIGPPTLQQTHKVLRQRSADEEEFWMITASLQNYWKLQAAGANLYMDQAEKNNGKPDHPFPNAETYENFTPSQTRWFIRRMRNLRADQLLSIVTILDKALNNTSVILLLETGKKKLLFPGDAQIENWEYVLKHEQTVAKDEELRQKYLQLLKETDLYKIGHHGSRNATPKTLWKSFSNKAVNDTKKEKAKALHTVVSTMEGKHGHTEATKVPRKTLVDELTAHSQYRSTQEITKDYKDKPSKPESEKGLYLEVEI